MAPPHHPCLFYGAECALNAAKGSDESDVALEDVRAGLRAGLVCGTQPDGTHNETDRDRGQGGEAGRDGIEVGLTVSSPRESGLSCATKVESLIKALRISTHLSATGSATLSSRPNAQGQRAAVSKMRRAKYANLQTHLCGRT